MLLLTCFAVILLYFQYVPVRFCSSSEVDRGGGGGGGGVGGGGVDREGGEMGRGTYPKEENRGRDCVL